MQKDILRKLVRSSFDTTSWINVGNFLTYLLGPVSLALSCLDGTIRKTCKSKFYVAAMNDLIIVEQNKLLSKSVMNTYFLDLAACHNSRSSMENFLDLLIISLREYMSAALLIKKKV